MEYKEFVCAVEKQMNRRLQGGVRASIYTAVKNNGQEKKGIIVETPGVNISPTIYLEEFYTHFQSGDSLEKVVKDILEFYESVRCEESWDYTQIENFDKMRKKLAIKLINTEKNRKVLENIPHRQFLDLSIVFYLLMEVKSEGCATILVNEEQRKRWGISVDELYKAALYNAQRLLPAQFLTMRQTLEEILVGPDGLPAGKNLLAAKDDSEKDAMYVLSNSEKSFGAACIVYPHILEMIGDILEEDFYVLPSSIHEIVIVPESKSLDQEEMDEMVAEINESQVAPEEVLADHAYFYRREIKQIAMRQKISLYF